MRVTINDKKPRHLRIYGYLVYVYGYLRFINGSLFFRTLLIHSSAEQQHTVGTIHLRLNPFTIRQASRRANQQANKHTSKLTSSQLSTNKQTAERKRDKQKKRKRDKQKAKLERFTDANSHIRNHVGTPFSACSCLEPLGCS